MKKPSIDESSKVINSTVGNNVGIREYCTIHDSRIGDNCRIYERVSIKKSEMGEGVVINTGTYVEFAEIEDDVQIGPNCSIVGVFHKITKKGAERRNSFKKARIRKRAFLGAGCTILPGKEIGESSVIGAGAVITKDIPPFHIVVGSPPNQIIKSLKDWLKKD